MPLSITVSFPARRLFKKFLEKSVQALFVGFLANNYANHVVTLINGLLYFDGAVNFLLDFSKKFSYSPIWSWVEMPNYGKIALETETMKNGTRQSY